MLKLPMLLGALTAFAAVPGFASDDPIATRQALMDSNGAAAALAGAIMKGEVDYQPVLGQAVIVAMEATAQAYGDYFPEGSQDPSRSKASPKIWEDRAGFEKELAAFQDAARKALDISGKKGPADKDAFAGAVKPLFDSCKSCHKAYRVDN